MWSDGGDARTHVAYVVKRFPKLSETFVLNEVAELVRQGEQVTVYSRLKPAAGEPRHPAFNEVSSTIVYLPRGMRRLVLLADATAMARRVPGRTMRAFAWSIAWIIRARTPQHVLYFLEAAHLARRLPSTVTHVHAHSADAATSIALLAGRFRNLSVSFSTHARDIFAGVPERFLREKMTSARFIAAETHYSAAHLNAIAGHRRPVVVIRNGLPPEWLLAAATATSPHSNGRRIACVARLVRKKGIDILLHACAQLARDGVPFSCTVIGAGPEQRRLQRLTRRLGISGSVQFLGHQAQPAVIATLLTSDIFVLPCRALGSGDRDNLPVALLEAMSLGLPVVTTPVAGIPEVVLHEETGLLCEQNDTEALAANIRRLFADPDLRSRLGRSAQAHVRSRFDLTTNVSRLREGFAEAPSSTQQHARAPALSSRGDDQAHSMQRIEESSSATEGPQSR